MSLLSTPQALGFSFDYHLSDFNQLLLQKALLIWTIICLVKIDCLRIIFVNIVPDIKAASSKITVYQTDKYTL